MASVLDHGLIKTAAIEQVVAPIAGHLCLLVLLCENANDPEQFVQLEGAAQAVAKATENLASVASRLTNETEEEVTRMEMSALLEPVTVSGQHVLLVAQKLSIQPDLPEHREELITATQSVMLGVVKVLLVSDDATVRRIVVAAAQVLECLSQLGSSKDTKTLLKSFQEFSDALLLLNDLTVERANSLQDPRQAKSLLDSLGTLSKCISMLHTAMCTTIKHPSSEQAQAAKIYILDKVESSVKDIVDTLHSRLRAWIASFSLELGDDPHYTVHRLQELCERWEDESSQLLDSLCDVVDVREFTSIAIGEMVNDRRGCDEAYNEQNYQMFAENAGHFNCHLRQVVDSVKRHLDRSDNPIYRNGLLVLLKQTAQETAMSSAMSTEAVYKHSAQFSDLINNMRKLLLPVAASWYHAIQTLVHGSPHNIGATVTEQLSEVISLSADVVQLLTRSDVTTQNLAAKHITDEKTAEEAEQQFETAAQHIVENIKSATQKVDDCLNYVRDPRARSNLRSINDHLSFQISDIVSRARLIVETRFVFDSLSLEVQIQCWSAKARYVTEEVLKTDGIQQEAKDHIRMGLQGTVPEDARGGLAPPPCDVKEGKAPTATDLSSWPKSHADTFDAPNMGMSEATMVKEDYLKRHDKSGISVCRDASSLACTSLFLKQETESWDPKDNRIVQVTRQMADKIYYMTQYLRRKGPIANKEAFVSTAKDVISNCQSVTQFVQVIANHCMDQQCTVELSLIVEQILTITNQLSIISSVNAVTPGCKSSDEILVKNSQNLLKTVLQGMHAAETACIKGLRQPEPHSDGAEAAALCFQWRRNLQIHRAQQNSNPDTDDLGLRKTSPRPLAPSLAPSSLQMQ
ncbi:hypothetical protein NHX12_022973 [Muraenolepis orangiensis]|uniref:Vinculin n=1 Tax=Muraenolepis orangiensis TaxID=630683 RepID=A0A9Q0ER70_9TELE|nr:hypothetical protein NHX12_022973 [Muraenolepis orangiensis]